MNLQTSADGRYDEALEASAERIMLATGTDQSSSGYSSDADTFADFHETKSCTGLGDCKSLLSSSDSVTSDSDSDSEDIDSEIAFLRQKQYLLKRAIAALKEDEIYEATRARSTASGSVPTESPIWLEAREVLDVLNRRYNEKEDKDEKRKAVPPTSVSVTPPATKRSRIDVSSVLCLLSSATGDNLGMTVITTPSATESEVSSGTFSSEGPWMAQALVHSLPSLSLQQGTSSACNKWEIINDPNRGPLVIPPSKIPHQSSIQLTDALAFTPVAQ